MLLVYREPVHFLSPKASAVGKSLCLDSVSATEGESMDLD